MRSLSTRSLALSMIALLVCAPILALMGSWLQWKSASFNVLAELTQTVLPDYIASSLVLCLGVAFGVTVIGLSTAAAVTLFKFPGQSWIEWALLLPMAMPAYVVAYAYTDFLQYSGPLQNLIRHSFALEGRVFPEIRSLGGAIFVFTLALYPYVYLLVRSALTEQASKLMEAARMLGAPLSRRIASVALPMARPAVAAGVTLALMETLADFGVSSYFGIQTFTAGVYKAWLVMDNRIAASQLATLLLVVILVLLQAEKIAQNRMRFSISQSNLSMSSEAQPIELSRTLQWLILAACSLPIFFGFVLPVVLMLLPFTQSDISVPWDRFGVWAFNSLKLGLTTAVLAVALALVISFATRFQASTGTRLTSQVVGLGYAVPGAVVVVGLLLPINWLQNYWPESQVGYWLTATSIGLVWAYLVRFTAVALQSIQSGYSRVPGSLDDAAQTLGVTGFELLRRVHAPLLKRSIYAATLLVFVDVMKELPATLVLRPFNSDTLAVVAYQLARDERLSEAALPSLALVLVGLLPVILLSRSLKQTHRDGPAGL